MKHCRRSFALGAVLAGLLLPSCLPLALAQGQGKAADRDASSLMLVLREAPGANKQGDLVVPADAGWFDYLGDMQLRFVFDAGENLRDASVQDLRALDLTPDQAVRTALKNIKRLYGEPEIRRGNGGLMLIQGRSADFSASYLLDKELWQGLLQQAPGGLVVAVPKRGGILFTPAADTKSVERLHKMIVQLHASSEHGRLSSALYLFKDSRWSIFQAPPAD
ncbi:MAG: hypothetical protein V4634_03015 [Pseudomonadota bacterium]